MNNKRERSCRVHQMGTSKGLLKYGILGQLLHLYPSRVFVLIPCTSILKPPVQPLSQPKSFGFRFQLRSTTRDDDETTVHTPQEALIDDHLVPDRTGLGCFGG